MKTHLFHFLILIAIIGLGVGIFFLASGNRGAQLLIGLTTSFAYVAWGLIHHAIEGDLHKKIVVEYVLMGAIAVLLFLIVFGP